MSENQFQNASPLKTAESILDLLIKLERADVVRAQCKLLCSIKEIRRETLFFIDLLEGPVPTSSLESLALNKDWRVGKILSIRARATEDGGGAYSVLEGQEVPAETTLRFGARKSTVRNGDFVDLNLKLVRRGTGRLGWKLINLNLNAQDFGYRRLPSSG